MTAIYHITHVSNLRSIATVGILCDDRAQSGEVSFKNIAYEDLKGRRSETPVLVHRGTTLANYAPFYFAPRSPMLCAISHDRVRGMEGKQTEVVHLVSSCEAVERAGLTFAFTDGHAVMSLSNFFRDLRNLDKIDWPVMRAKYWNSDGTGEMKRKRQAEFLVADYLPWWLVEEIGVATNRMVALVQEQISGSRHLPVISVHPEWYY